MTTPSDAEANNDRLIRNDALLKFHLETMLALYDYGHNPAMPLLINIFCSQADLEKRFRLMKFNMLRQKLRIADRV
jgi:hypothetical protein